MSYSSIDSDSKDNYGYGSAGKDRVGGVAIVCKDPFLREGIASILENEGNFRIVAKSDELATCIGNATKGGATAVSIYDDGISEKDRILLPGIKATGALKILIINDSGKADANADVTLSKAEAKTALVKTLRSLVGTPRRVSVAQETRAAYGARLTSREYEVAKLVAKGFSNRSISEELELREQSVKNLVSVIMRKLDCENRTQMALHLLGLPRR